MCCHARHDRDLCHSPKHQISNVGARGKHSRTKPRHAIYAAHDENIDKTHAYLAVVLQRIVGGHLANQLGERPRGTGASKTPLSNGDLQRPDVLRMFRELEIAHRFDLNPLF